MIKNPFLARSIMEICGEARVRVVLPTGAIEEIRSFFEGICRICTPREIFAYALDPSDETRMFAWVERMVKPADVEKDGQRLYEIRRPLAPDPNPNPIPEKRAHPKPVNRIYYVECTAVPCEPDEPSRPMFDIDELVDLPPKGYPPSGTSVEYARNLAEGRGVESPMKEWARREWSQLMREIEEERSAWRVFNREKRGL